MAKPAARLALMQVLLAAGAVVIGGRAVMLQVVQHDAWEARAAARDQRDREVPARRGTIYDRHGVPLAITQERYRLSIAMNEVRDTATLVRHLVGRLGIPREEVTRKLRRPYPYFYGPFSAEQVEPLWRTRGMHFEVLYGRSYPRRASGRDPLLGYIDVSRNRGLDGLERSLDTLLQGRSGLARMIRDPRGQEIAIPRGVLRQAEPGRDVILTIDHQWQAIAEGALRRAVDRTNADGGDVVILDIHSGELLAVASLRPDDRTGRPIPTPSALVEPYEPGSTAKIFTVAAMLRAGSDTTPVSGEGGVWTMEVGGGRTRTIRDVSRQSGLLSPGLAIKYSSNIAMSKFALQLPFQSHYETLRDFGIGTPAALGFRSEAEGMLQRPGPTSNPRLTQPSWAQGYELSASAVQLAAAYGAIANHGLLMAPTLVREVRNGVTGAVEWRHEPTPVRQAVTPEIAEQLMRYLRLSTDSGAGGNSARLDRILVVGKTGTAVLRDAAGNYGGAGHRASFAGIFPADAPEVVIYVMVVRPRGVEIYGGQIAAPVVPAILKQVLATTGSPFSREMLMERVSLPPARPRPDAPPPMRLVPFPTPPRAPDPGGGRRAVPDLTGRSLREAAHRLHQQGFLVRVQGTGPVRASTPAPGDSLPAGATVTLIAGTD